LAVAARLRDRRECREFGGAHRLLSGVAIEWLLSALLAPVLMLEHARFVLEVLVGRSVGWNAQTRTEHSVGLGDALRRHGATALIGVAWIVVLVALAPQLLWWMLPVPVGMVLSIPLAVFSSRTDLGRWMRGRGLLLTPEETAPEPVLRRLRELVSRRPPATRRARGNALERVLADPDLRIRHLGLQHDAREELDPLLAHEIEGVALKARMHGAETLTPEEQRLILRTPHALEALAQDAIGDLRGVGDRA
jgi:membrane glycosyltransferase